MFYKEDTGGHKMKIFEEFIKVKGEDTLKKMCADYIDFNINLSHLAECYNVSETIIRKLLDYAVIHCLVSDHEANQMKLKSHANQVRHSQGEHITSSDKRYARLFEKRELFKKMERVKAELTQLYFKVEAYCDFAFEEDGKSFEEGKSELENRIWNLEDKFQKLQKEYEEPL